ncbi:MAG: DUF3791 domain-containing protein [Veillonellales bacterium]
MSKNLPFLVYCIEEYKTQKRMTGRATMELFKKYGVQNYLYDCYDALHTTGSNYIINDIDNFIRERDRKIIS